jgi:diacylglycerol kinase
MNLFSRTFRKFSHAFRGMASSFKEEKSIITHFIFALLVIGFGFYMEISTTE